MSGFEFKRAIPFIEAIPSGRWTSFKDVAAAAGNPKAFQTAGNKMRDSGGRIRNYWRVIHSDGSVPENFTAPADRGPKDPYSARQHKQAIEALDLLCSAATAHVAAQWAPLAPEQYGSRSGSLSWLMFPTCRDGAMPLEGREFDLNLFRDSSSCFRDGRSGVPVFTVGTSGEPGTIAALDAETADALAGAGFELLPMASLLSNNWDRIWRRAYPDELLAGASLNEQGKSLARWAVDAFEQLHDIVAPAPAR